MDLNTPAVAGRTSAPPPLVISGSGYLSFRLGREEYGIDILKVQEIRGFESPTRIAGAHSHIKGVVNLRGVIVPIADLRLKFGLDDAEFGDTTVVIILNVADRVVGIVVDSVSDVVQFDIEQVRPAPEFNAAVDASYITGLGSISTEGHERLLILADIESLMRSPEMGLFQLSLAVH